LEDPTPGSSVEDQLVGVRERVSDLEATNHGSQQRGSSGGSANATVDRLLNEMESLRRKVRHMEAGGRNGIGGGLDNTIIRQLELLNARLGDLEWRGSESGFVLNEHTSSSFAELKEWVRDKEIPSCGVYWDLFSAMVCMGPKRPSGKERANNIHSSERIQSTPHEDDLAASMTHDKPACLFGKEGGELSAMSESFEACTSYAAWIGIGNTISYKKLLSDRLTTFISGIRGALVRHLNPGY
jgi:hypothetical protein